MERKIIVAWIFWAVVVLAFIQGGWMSFDGTRALTKGDYMTPQEGEYAGQLGPWAGLVTAMGINPRSGFMKSLFVVYGVAWQAGAVLLFFKVSWAWWFLMVLSIGSLWYLPVGTLISLVQIGLLYFLK